MPTFLSSSPKSWDQRGTPEDQLQAIKYDIHDLWKRLNDIRKEVDTITTTLDEPMNILQWKNWRIRPDGLDLVLDFLQNGAWIEDARAVP